MPIASHAFTQVSQVDGSISYVLRMYDQDGVERMRAGFLPQGTDTAAFVAQRIVEADVQLAEEEFQSLVGL